MNGVDTIISTEVEDRALPASMEAWDEVSTSLCGFRMRPKIRISKRYLDDLTNDVLGAIMHENDPPCVFQRNGSLVRLKKVDDTRVAIELINKDMLISRMARVADFVDDMDDPVHPPSRVASDILSLHEWDFPGLSGVVSTPVLRKDGTVLSLPGYDGLSGLYYRPSPGLYVPDIPEEPTKEDAVDAANYILTEVFGDFPYEDDASRANALSALVTPVVRPVIDGCTPLFLFDKPAAGSGATLQTEIISNLVTGKSADLKHQSDRDEEMRKQITSWLLTGPQMIIIDNVDTAICSSNLSSVITCRTWSDRILGHSKQAEVPNLACWYATGNNIQLAGDIPRRACLIRIDAKVPKPWERDVNQFKHPDILQWVSDRRGIILSKILVIARAWHVAGKPKGSAKSLGGFENWTFTLSGMLEFAGVAGLLENAAYLAERDSGADQWDSFLSKWHDIFGSKPILMKELLEEVWKEKALAEVMPEEIFDVMRGSNKKGVGIKVAKALVKKTGITYSNGLRLIRGEDAHAGQKTWRVEKQH